MKHNMLLSLLGDAEPEQAAKVALSMKKANGRLNPLLCDPFVCFYGSALNVL